MRLPLPMKLDHVNVYALDDGDGWTVIDTGFDTGKSRAVWQALLQGPLKGRPVTRIIATHHHPDHASSGAEHLADRLGVPVAAHVRTKTLLEGRVRVTRTIEDGELIELPCDREGARPRRLRAILTEGHADGHLVFHEEETNTLIAGDMVAGIGTIVVDPPEGKMAVYLESLARLQELGADLIYPSHGPTIGDPAAFLQFYVDHRLMREEKVLAALDAGPCDVATLVPRAYDDKPPEVYPFAERAALAHLLKLEAEGRGVRDGETWRRA